MERVTGLDSTTIAARIGDAARRARETAIEAVENGDHTIVLRAGDAEVRALSMLSAMGETSETEIELRAMFKDIAAAVIRVARRDAEAAEAIAEELELMHRPILAEDVRDQIPDSRNEVTP